MLLPLTPTNSYAPKVLILGGGGPSTNTTELIDFVCTDAGVDVWSKLCRSRESR